MFRSPLTDALIVIVILLLIVDPKKLPQLGRGHGDGMREFRKASPASTRAMSRSTSPR